mmetsp:Transcript_6212/g.13099  ORF Transcript_6212/g.13099 Transcript_6212/m.13099 type:complete len:307 (+) Transcript_6212:1035-1955(+)
MLGHRKRAFRMVHPRLRTESIAGIESAQPPHGMRGNSPVPPLPHEMESSLHPRVASLTLPHVGCPHAVPMRDQPRELSLRRGRHQRRDHRGRFGSQHHHPGAQHPRLAPVAAQTEDEVGKRPQGQCRRSILGGAQPLQGRRPQHPRRRRRSRLIQPPGQSRRRVGRENEHPRRCLQPGPRTRFHDPRIQRRRPHRRQRRKAIPMGCRPRGLFEILRGHVAGLSKIPPGRRVSRRADVVEGLRRGVRGEVPRRGFRFGAISGFSTVFGGIDRYAAIRRFRHQEDVQCRECPGRDFLRSEHRRQEESE